MNLPKLTTLALLAIVGALGAQGAAAQVSVGGGLTYGEELEELGINARVGFQLTDYVEAVAGYSYFFIDDGIDFSTVNVDAHITVVNNGGFDAYLLGGVNLAILSFDDFVVPGFAFVDGDTETEFGANLGAGLRFGISNSADIFAEAKYVVGDADQFVLTSGVRFQF